MKVSMTVTAGLLHHPSPAPVVQKTSAVVLSSHCIHTAEVEDRVTGLKTRRWCSYPTHDGRPNGYLCADHQKHLDHPISKPVDPFTLDGEDIAASDALLIKLEDGFEVSTTLHLSDFRKCRRIWNRRDRTTPTSQKQIIDAVIARRSKPIKTVFLGEEEHITTTRRLKRQGQ